MTRKYFRWTEREIEFLKRNYQHGPTWVAARLGRGVKSVQAKMYMLGLATRKLNAWRDEEIEFLVKNYGKLTREEIAKRLGRSYASVNNKITELGLASNKCSRMQTKQQERHIELQPGQIISLKGKRHTYKILKVYKHFITLLNMEHGYKETLNKVDLLTGDVCIS